LYLEFGGAVLKWSCALPKAVVGVAEVVAIKDNKPQVRVPERDFEYGEEKVGSEKIRKAVKRIHVGCL